MIAFVDEYRDCFSVECICRVLNEHMVGGFITSRGYRLVKKRPLSSRALRDEVLVGEVRRVFEENYRVYGVRKLWHAMRQKGWNIGRDQVARLMRVAGISGVRRGRKPVTTRHCLLLILARTWFNAGSAPTRRTGCGLRTSPMCLPCPGSSIRSL